MPVGAIIGGVAALGSALLTSSAAGKASKTQADAANRAADMQMQQFNQTREDMTPYRVAGGKAITSLSDMLQPGYDYTKSPGYDFRFNEGQRAIESGAAARGMLMSGGTLKDLARFGQGAAAQDFNDSFNRTASVAQGGQQVGIGLGQLGQRAGAGAGDALIQAGNARASGYAGQAGALNGGLSSLALMAQNGGFNGLFGGAAPNASLAPGINTMMNSNAGLF